MRERGAAGKEPAYYVECESLLGLSGSELCEGDTWADVENNAEPLMGVLGTFLEFNAADMGAQPLAACTLTGAETGELLGMGDTYAVEGTVAAPQYLHRLDTLIDNP